jgi:hypothetical protein
LQDNCLIRPASLQKLARPESNICLFFGIGRRCIRGHGRIHFFAWITLLRCHKCFCFLGSSEKGCVGGIDQAAMPVRCESTVGTLRTLYITRYFVRHCWVACGLALRGPRSDITWWTPPTPTSEGTGLCASAGLMHCTMGWGEARGRGSC